MEAPFQKQFTPSCNKHDICYGCGHHYNWTRDLCDDAFLSDMKNTCKERRHHVRHRRFVSALLEVWYFFQGLSKEERRCNLVAEMYYKAVRTFGKPNFEVRENQYCNNTCADKHGSPYMDLPKLPNL
ncbi:predicted protein [Nematostella vectensis]|uniref:Conodipine-M alpha chain n=2 Tax=Nematostella vectensis TaxID=45351 RepID=A7T079_NEMVE|nr:predicted protein [Nematostella vectensis]|eukprot:XP_001622740.1 predicted protein [Nematostella vectensis]